MKGCFGAINVENEIEIEKFFGTNIVKNSPFPFVGGRIPTTPRFLLGVHFITFKKKKGKSVGGRSDYGFSNVTAVICPTLITYSVTASRHNTCRTMLCFQLGTLLFVLKVKGRG